MAPPYAFNSILFLSIFTIICDSAKDDFLRKTAQVAVGRFIRLSPDLLPDLAIN